MSEQIKLFGPLNHAGGHKQKHKTIFKAGIAKKTPTEPGRQQKYSWPGVSDKQRGLLKSRCPIFRGDSPYPTAAHQAIYMSQVLSDLLILK